MAARDTGCCDALPPQPWWSPSVRPCSLSWVTRPAPSEDANGALSGWRASPAPRRLAVMVVVGVVAAVAVGVLGSWSYAPLAGWDLAVLVFSG